MGAPTAVSQLKPDKERTHTDSRVGHNVSRDCYIRDYHFAYCTAIIRNSEGALGFCGERFMVKSSGGCGTHTFTAGYNKDLQRARLKGTSGLPQPEIPT
jgi:hypothetical protein